MDALNGLAARLPWAGRPVAVSLRALLLRRSPRLARAVVQGTSALLLVLDPDGRLVVVNPAVLRSTGFRESELLGERFVDVLAVPEEAALAEEAIADAFASGVAHPQEGEWLDRRGGRRRVAMQNSLLTDRWGRPYAYVSVGLDVTQRRREEAALRHRADTDVLTGLANRGAFFVALQQSLAEDAERVGLLFCDLDGFKQANDLHGHAVGDLLLVEVASRLRSLAAPGDLAARIGGDEFVLLARPADERRLAALAAAVEEAVRRPVRVGRGRAPVDRATTPSDGVPLELGVSVGTALGWSGASADDLVAEADREMYAVKSRRTLRPRARTTPRSA